jgi:hypothetical protein
MSLHKHDIESGGSKRRDHVHPRHHLPRQLHKDWRVWTAVALMLAMMLVYVMTDGLSLRHGRAIQPTPAANAP